MEKADINLMDFSSVLEHKKLLEIVGNPNWQKLSINHGIDSLTHYDFSEPQQLRKLFTDQKKVAGIYAYFLHGKCLYIGKSKNIQERIYQHFLESCQLWGHQRYQDFFSSHCGEIDLYILRLGNHEKPSEFIRTIVEKILEAYHQPKMSSIKL